MKHTVEEIKLPNGARGLLIDIPGATVMSFRFNFRAGNRFVKDRDIYETAHIMEHMAFGANAKFKNEQEYEFEFTKNGAYHNAYTGDLSVGYVADCADFEWDRILELQQLAICHPKFNEHEFEAEKGNVKSELNCYLNNHNRVLWPKIQQLLGEDVCTYWQRLHTISKIKLSDIKEHHKKTHTAKNMRFVIAGKLNGRKAEIKRRLSEWGLAEGERLSNPVDEYVKGHTTLIRRKEATNLTFGWSMVLSRELNDEEAEAMSCLDHILTGTLHSRIYGNARRKGLAYGMFSDTSVGAGCSSWDFGGQVDLDTSKALFGVVVDEFNNVLNGKLTKEELEAAKSYAIGRYQMGAQTVAQISNFYTDRFFADDVIRNYEQVPDHIKRVTLDRMMGTAKEFISNEKWVLAGVSSGEKEDIVELNDMLETLYKKSA